MPYYIKKGDKYLKLRWIGRGIEKIFVPMSNKTYEKPSKFKTKKSAEKNLLKKFKKQGAKIVKA